MQSPMSVSNINDTKPDTTSWLGLQVPLADGGSSVFDTTGFYGDVMIGLPPLT